MAKTEFFILLASLKHIPPLVFPVSVNSIIICQSFKPKTWELSSTPPLHPPPHHNFILATPISLLNSYIALFVSLLPPLILPNQSPHVKFYMTSLTMQMHIFRSCPLLETLQLLPLDPSMKSNVHNVASEAFRHLSISPNLPLAQLSALQFSILSMSVPPTSCAPSSLRGWHIFLLLCESYFSPNTTLLWSHLLPLTLPVLADMLIF